VNDFDEFDEDSSGTIFRDVIMLALIGFVAMVILLLPHLKKSAVEAQDHRAPGNLIVEMHWPSDMPYDVDLWVMGPNSTPVGFWNQGNRIFNLLRDDLGVEGDATDENYEVSYSRGIEAGDYVVNVHMYGMVPNGVKVPVKVVISVRNDMEATKQILQTEIILDRRNQEETAFRFSMTGDGQLIEDSVTTLRKRLITQPL
jgi:hypothetical protein